jgi:hypothetical protein
MRCVCIAFILSFDRVELKAGGSGTALVASSIVRMSELEQAGLGPSICKARQYEDTGEFPCRPAR